jgi:uncharacterized membrane protein YidH (DUF202 family)
MMFQRAAMLRSVVGRRYATTVAAETEASTSKESVAAAEVEETQEDADQNWKATNERTNRWKKAALGVFVATVCVDLVFVAYNSHVYGDPVCLFFLIYCYFL